MTVTKYTIKTDKLTEAVRIALLSDLHNGVFGEEQEALIAKIDTYQPDIIVMTGDIMDEDLPHGGAEMLLRGISGKYDAYYVTGNHEYKRGHVDKNKEMFRSMGVSVLEGTRKAVRVGGQTVNICGVDDPLVGNAAFEQQLDKALSGIDTDIFTILLSHRPDRFEKLSEYPCDLILSGHAHGGQWRVPFIINGVYAPGQGLFPQYTSGIYTLNGTDMLVSRGLALDYTSVPRIFNPPELVIIDIVPGR